MGVELTLLRQMHLALLYTTFNVYDFNKEDTVLKPIWDNALFVRRSLGTSAVYTKEEY